MPDKFRNKRKLEKQHKAAAKQAHGHTNGGGMGDEYPEEHNARSGMDSELPEGHSADDR